MTFQTGTLCAGGQAPSQREDASGTVPSSQESAAMDSPSWAQLALPV